MSRAVYIRTSMKDQHGHAQEHELNQAIKAREWDPKRIQKYVDKGVSSRRAKRPALDELRKAASRGIINEVMITKLDRLGRSVVDLDKLVQEFEAYGCKLIFLKDSIDTNTASGRLLFHVLSSVAEFERDRLRERVYEGLDAAKEKGVKFGRPKREIPKDLLFRAVEMANRGNSMTWIAKYLKLPRSTVYRSVRPFLKPIEKLPDSAT